MHVAIGGHVTLGGVVVAVGNEGCECCCCGCWKESGFGSVRVEHAIVQIVLPFPGPLAGASSSPR